MTTEVFISSQFKRVATAVTQRLQELLDGCSFIIDSHRTVITSTNAEMIGRVIEIDPVALRIPFQVDKQLAEVIIPKVEGSEISPRLARVLVELVISQVVSIARQPNQLELKNKFIFERKNYLEDQYEILSEQQRQLPRIYLEHDPPREHPTDTQHIVNDSNLLLVHVTHFNNLMWDSGCTPTCVIEHGVIVPETIRYTGKIDAGVVVVNGLKSRGRRLGVDVFERVRSQVPIELVGMQAEKLGRRGEVPHFKLAEFTAQYRFFFNPIRYTSLGLAICEAMMLGMPIIGLATTEMATLIENHVSGCVDTNVDALIEFMQYLLKYPKEAHHLSQGARQVAEKRFNIDRFVRDWDRVFARVMDRNPAATGIPFAMSSRRLS
jgi:glycosyltransferase involved in cell wall biosynthesis